MLARFICHVLGVPKIVEVCYTAIYLVSSFWSSYLFNDLLFAFIIFTECDIREALKVQLLMIT